MPYSTPPGDKSTDHVRPPTMPGGELLALTFALLCLGVLVWSLYLLGTPDALPLSYSTPWIEPLGINLAFYFDALSALFAVLISGVGFLIFLYTRAYFAGSTEQFRAVMFLGAFALSMLGVVSSDNLILLFVFWELTSLTSYFLIGLKHHLATARIAALQALLVTATGGILMLVGFLVLGISAGTFEISEINATYSFGNDSTYLIVFLLVAVGAFTKSAQFPFHFWLPSAMAAPSPVSAYLHAATMVKAGVFLLLRFHPLLGNTALWQFVLCLVGGTTLVFGTLAALGQDDLKRLLAYSTVASLGMLVLLIGIGTALAFQTLIVFLLAHGLYKACLFLGAGGIEHATGRRQVSAMGGVNQALPALTTAFVLGLVSMAGLPPAIGFVSKEIFYQTTLSSSPYPLLLTITGVLANALFAAISFKIFASFFDSPKGPSEVRALKAGIFWPVCVLSLLGLFISSQLSLVQTYLVAPLLQLLAPGQDVIPLALWHGLNKALALSAVTIFFALLIFSFRRWLGRAMEALSVMLKSLNPDLLYHQGLELIISCSAGVSHFFQSGHLRSYLRYTFLSVTVTMLLVLSFWPRAAISLGVAPGVLELIILLLILGTCISVIRTGSILAAMLRIGALGISITAIFALQGAPDLAITQLLADILLLVFFVSWVERLPSESLSQDRSGRRIDLAISLVFGGLMGWLALLCISTDALNKISDYFALNSFVQALGKNVVNVILVDFRGFDTLGEITVLLVAAIGVLVLSSLAYQVEERE